MLYASDQTIYHEHELAGFYRYQVLKAIFHSRLEENEEVQSVVWVAFEIVAYHMECGANEST